MPPEEEDDVGGVVAGARHGSKLAAAAPVPASARAVEMRCEAGQVHRAAGRVVDRAGRART